MRVLVTGATGFVGQHLVRHLLAAGHQVTAVARDLGRAKAHDWYGAVKFKPVDIHACDVAALVAGTDAIAHLSWHGLPNYRGRFHFETNLPRDYEFLRAAVQAGVRQIMVTGTCLEFGPDSAGRIAEGTPADPRVPYALAKDSLRKYLEILKLEFPFCLQWVRLFYMHGAGQNPQSLLSQLDRAIDEGRETFDMSGGEQLRDYLPVTDVAAKLAAVLEQPQIEGCINCCSGKPISVRRLVEEHVHARGATIRLNLGAFPYPDYEPMAFWGSSEKLSQG